MKTSWMLVAALAAACTGCTSLSLERQSLGQIHATRDYECEAALNCLAAVAADPTTLPPFAVLSDGVAKVSDTGTVSSSTQWTRAVGSFAMQTLGVTGAHSPQLTWTIDPVADYPQLLAMRAACRWVLSGPEHADCEAPGILNSPALDPSPGPHFGVIDRLSRLPAGWLHHGGLRDVPVCACYKGHCGSTWVWVTADGIEGLSDFILVLHDVATLDPNAALFAPPLLVNLEVHESLLDMPPVKRVASIPTMDLVPLPLALMAVSPGSGPIGLATAVGRFVARVPDWSGQNSSQLLFSQLRVIKPECRACIEQKIQAALCGQAPAQISWQEWLACTTPYTGQRATLSPASSLSAVKPSEPAPRFPAPPEPLLNPQGVRIGPTISIPTTPYQGAPPPPVRPGA